MGMGRVMSSILAFFLSPKSLAGFAVGAMLTFTAATIYNVVIDNPSIRRATIADEHAKFTKAVEGLSDDADKAIALATACRAAGDQWLSGQRKCVQAGH